MSTYAYRFVGQEKLFSRLSEFDREQFFQLTAADIQALDEQFRSDHRAPAALLVLFLRAAGRPLDSFTMLPRNLLRYVGETFKTSAPTIASLRSIYQRSQTLYKHQLWAKNHLGLKDLDVETEAELAGVLALHAAGWDELLRVVASIRVGKVSAELALRLLGSAAQGDPAYRAADHLGRLLRSIFLCDYVAIPDFRREIHTLLSRGESVHQLQRAIYTGRIAPERGRRRDEMKAISGSHALLTNIVLAWNTSRMDDVVERLRKDGMSIDDAWLRRMGPVHFGHINFRGTFRFGIEKYEEALLRQSSATGEKMRSEA
jgi:hypothetical protein